MISLNERQWQDEKGFFLLLLEVTQFLCNFLQTGNKSSLIYIYSKVKTLTEQNVGIDDEEKTKNTVNNKLIDVKFTESPKKYLLAKAITYHVFNFSYFIKKHFYN